MSKNYLFIDLPVHYIIKFSSKKRIKIYLKYFDVLITFLKHAY